MKKIFAQSLGTNRSYRNAAGGRTEFQSTSLQGRYYERGGRTNLGGNARTRGRQRPIQRVGR